MDRFFWNVIFISLKKKVLVLSRRCPRKIRNNITVDRLKYMAILLSRTPVRFTYLFAHDRVYYTKIVYTQCFHYFFVTFQIGFFFVYIFFFFSVAKIFPNNRVTYNLSVLSYTPFSVSVAYYFNAPLRQFSNPFVLVLLGGLSQKKFGKKK